jgi:hypothetical protein
LDPLNTGLLRKGLNLRRMDDARKTVYLEQVFLRTEKSRVIFGVILAFLA